MCVCVCVSNPREFPLSLVLALIGQEASEPDELILISSLFH